MHIPLEGYEHHVVLFHLFVRRYGLIVGERVEPVPGPLLGVDVYLLVLGAKAVFLVQPVFRLSAYGLWRPDAVLLEIRPPSGLFDPRYALGHILDIVLGRAVVEVLFYSPAAVGVQVPGHQFKDYVPVAFALSKGLYDRL